MKKTTFISAILYTILMTVFAVLSGAEEGSIVSNLPNAAPWLLPWVALAVAWKNMRNGGILYLVLAIASVFFFQTYQNFAPFLMVTLPLLVIGGMFLRISSVCKNTDTTEPKQSVGD